MATEVSVTAVVVLVASCVAAATDVWRFKVYNVLTFPMLVLGPIYHTAIEGMPGFTNSLLGLTFGFGVLLPFYMIGATGAGDVKFVAALGAWCGVEPMLPILLIGCVATGLYSFVLLIYRGDYRDVWFNMQLMFLRLASLGRHLGVEDRVESVQAMAKKDDRRRRLVPFSAMVTVGVIATYVWSKRL